MKSEEEADSQESGAYSIPEDTDEESIIATESDSQQAVSVTQNDNGVDEAWDSDKPSMGATGGAEQDYTQGHAE
ncbi:MULTISPECIES: hypothetical protein [unclassified Bilifractor]|uniref:hypothetical protein n=1 Tax=unclassified Bilifractor TaxID=2815795 RepID=UPI003F914AE0